MASRTDKIWLTFFVIAVLVIPLADQLPKDVAFFQFVTQWKGAIVIALSIGAIGHVFSRWAVPDN